VNVCHQYLVPKDGTPLSGLIQDHMIAGVKLSLRGRFFTESDYKQLVFQALSFKSGKITLLRPSIVKPRALWSGKQILSTVIINVIPEGQELINMTATAKIGAKVSDNNCVCQRGDICVLRREVWSLRRHL
jgi:DNA-directed RNA polymerase I subunit RPA1